MDANLDQELLSMIKVVIQGPNSRALRKFVEFLYEQDAELLSEADWAAIREGQEDVRQGRVISLEEYEKAIGL